MSQPMQALAQANKVRIARAVLHREVLALSQTDGLALIADMLDRREPFIQSMLLRELLMWPERWGRVRVLRRLALLRISESMRVQGLTDRQVAVLVSLLRDDCEFVEADVA